MKRIFVIDDHPIVPQGLAQLLNNEPDLVVCGQAASAKLALQQVCDVQPDLVILDLHLEGLMGLDLLKDLRAFLPKLPVLIFSMQDELVYAERSLGAGARGYVMKMAPVEHLLQAIHRLLRGEIYVSEAIAQRTINHLVGAQRSRHKDGHSLVDTLSDRELQVLQAIGQGKHTRTIAAELHISHKTVDTHRMHLKGKLRLPSSQALLGFAIKWAQQSPSSE